MSEPPTLSTSWLAALRKCPYCELQIEGPCLVVHVLWVHPLRFSVESDRRSGVEVPAFCSNPEFFKEEDEQAVARLESPQHTIDSAVVVEKSRKAIVEKKPKRYASKSGSRSPSARSDRMQSGRSCFRQRVPSPSARSECPWSRSPRRERRRSSIERRDDGGSKTARAATQGRRSPSADRPNSVSSSGRFLPCPPRPTFDENLVRRPEKLLYFRPSDFTQTTPCKNYAECGWYITRACNSMLLTGRCSRGLNCTYLHPTCLLAKHGKCHDAECYLDHVGVTKFMCCKCHEELNRSEIGSRRTKT